MCDKVVVEEEKESGGARSEWKRQGMRWEENASRIKPVRGGCCGGRSVVPATQGTKVGGSQVQGQFGPLSDTLSSSRSYGSLECSPAIEWLPRIPQ